MRRKAASKVQSQPTKEENIAEAESVSDGEIRQGGSAIEIENEIADVAAFAKHGKKRGIAGNSKVNEDSEETVEEKAVSAPKRGRKKAVEDSVGVKIDESDSNQDAETKEKVAEAVTDVSNDVLNGAEIKIDEKSTAVSKRGRNKAVNENSASDKVPVSKRGRKPAVKKSNGENTSGFKSVEEDASDNKTELSEESEIPKEISETSENQSDDKSVPETKSISKAGKRGRKKAEVKVVSNEIDIHGVLNSGDDKNKEDKSSILSEDDFQPSSHSAPKKGTGKRAQKSPDEKIKGNEKNQAVDNSAADISSSKDEMKSGQPAKRGRKRKNKIEDIEIEQVTKVPLSISDDSIKKMKAVKVILNRDDALVDNAEKSADEEVDTDSKGKAKTVPSQKGRAAKRGKEKEETGDAGSTQEKPGKVPKKTEKSKKEKIPDVTSLDFSSDCKTSSGRPWNFKISSWNINGIRAWLEKDGLSYLHHEKPDILCVQETKCSDDKLPAEVKKVEGYYTYWLAGDKDGYSGVGLLSKEEPLKVDYGIGISEHDNEGRVITAEYEKFFLVAAYVPNAGRGLVRLTYRTSWDKDFRAYLQKLDEQKHVILCGDLNVAHKEIDLANPKTNKKNAGFTKEEREGFSTLLGEESFVDTFRHLYPDTKGAYTFWTYMMNARAKNVGWRLDYFVISKRFEESLCDSTIRKDVFGSDHCPVTLFLAV